jgi:Leucine-rich repeat (LRR) protein
MASIKNYSNQGIFEIDELVELYNEAGQVEHLDLSSNKLTTLPESLELFNKLKYLDISRNLIASIKNISLCINLENLNLSYNELKSISEGFFGLKNLTNLDLSYNQLTVSKHMINSFRYNKHLRSLSLKGNPKYDFTAVKFLCLDTLSQLETLDDKIIFKKAKLKQVPVTCSVKGTAGDVQVKTIKDYIKLKKEESDVTQNIKNQDTKKIILPDTKVANKPRGFYYFSNMILDK